MEAAEKPHYQVDCAESGEMSIGQLRERGLLRHVTSSLLLYLAHPRAPLGISNLVWLISLTKSGLCWRYPEISHGGSPLFAFYQNSGY